MLKRLSKRFIRIIPKLDIKNGILIKGINLEGLRVLGNPYKFAEYYAKNYADEICYLDNVATLYGTNNLGTFIKKTASNLNIPLVVGGGIKSLDNIKKILEYGADRVCLNSAIIKNPKLVNRAAKIFGSSTITAIIEYTKIGKKYFTTFSNGRDLVDKDPVKWATELEDMGAGEIVLTSVSHEGLRSGFEKKITKLVSKKVKIPVIAHGGAGKYQDVYDIISSTNISGVSIASLFHYDAIKSLKFSKQSIGNTDYLNNSSNTKGKSKNHLIKLKKFLKRKNINVRI